MVYVDQLPLSLSFQGVDHYIFMTVYILFNQLLGDSTWGHICSHSTPFISLVEVLIVSSQKQAAVNCGSYWNDTKDQHLSASLSCSHQQVFSAG